MALPTSDNTVNVTRLGSILSTLWGKIKTKFGTKVDKVANATSGNLASLDSNGNLTDSTKSVSDLQSTYQAPRTLKVGGQVEIVSAEYPSNRKDITFTKTDGTSAGTLGSLVPIPDSSKPGQILKVGSQAGILEWANIPNIAPEFSTSSTYDVNDRVMYQGQLYRCTSAVTTAGEWNSSNWTATDIDSELGTSQETLYLHDYFSYDSSTQSWTCVAVPPLINLIANQGKDVSILNDSGELYRLAEYTQPTSAGYLFVFFYEELVTSFDTASHLYEYHIYVPANNPTPATVQLTPLDSVTSRDGHSHGNLAADGTDGQTTHDTTKFLRGDGSWEVPTEKFVATLTATSQNDTYTISCDESILDIAEAFYANKDVWIQYTEYGVEFRFKVNYVGDMGEDPTTHVHVYSAVAVLPTGDQTFLLVGKNYENGAIVPDIWEFTPIDDNEHRHGTTTTGITSTGTMPGTIDSTKVLRGDGTWDAIHMHTINVAPGKFIRIRIPANTTVGHSSILFMRAYNKNSAYFCVNFAKYEDNTAFSQSPTINILLSNNHGNPDYIPQPGTNSSGDYRSCYTVNTNGDAYIFLYCSASYVGNYIINSNANANLISVDIVSNTSSADSTLTPTLQGPANVRVNTYHTNETFTPLAGNTYNPIYIDSGGQAVASYIFTGYSDLATTEMLYFKLPNTTNYGSITFHSSVASYALEYKVAFATSSGAFTVVPTITTCYHYVNNTNAKPIVYYKGSGTDLYFGFTGGNVKRIRWDAQMQNMGSMTCTKINRSDVPSGLGSDIPYDSPRPQLGTYTNWSDGTSTYIGRLAAIKYATASGNYVNLTGTVLFQQYSNQCSGHWQLRVNATNGSFVLGAVYGTNIPTGFSLCAGIATYTSDSSPWRGELYIYGKLTGLAYSAVSITIDQAVEGSAAPQNLYTEFYSNLSDSLTNTNLEFQNRNLPYSTNATVGTKFEPVYVSNGVVTGSSQYFRSVTASSNFSLMASPYNTSSVPTGAIVFVTNTGSSAINVTYKSGLTVPVNANNTRVFGKISNTFWAFGQTSD